MAEAGMKLNTIRCKIRPMKNLALKWRNNSKEVENQMERNTYLKQLLGKGTVFYQI
jgi:hypothetical protein